VLTHVYNLFVGGSAIEDIADLQQSEPVRRMLGAARIPDPSTAGDFLRRFDRKSIAALDEAIDEAQERVWKRRYGTRKCALGIVDLDLTCGTSTATRRKARTSPTRAASAITRW
jgi:hypothetical protein